MERKHEAYKMAEFIEKWLGNPVTKNTLKFMTKRCSRDGRRTERALEMYSGRRRDLCFSCRVSSFFINRVIDNVVARSELDKKDVKEQLGNSMWRKGLSSVLEGVAEYGPSKPFTAAVPFLVVWNITRACNLRCRHCYEVAEKPTPDELTTKEALKAVDRMAEAGVAYIAISGGEPLIRKDFFRVAERIQKRGMGFSIATNGTLLTKDNINKLKKYNCLFVQVSLDGANARSHNWFRGRESFEKTIAGIRNAVAEKINVGISTTVTNHNYNEVEDIIGLAEKIGATTFMHYNFIPTGRGKDIVGLDISPEQREKLLKMLAKQAKKRKINILSTAPQYGRVCAENDSEILAMTHFDISGPELKDSVKFLAEFIGGCGTGRLYCALEPNGDIKPCVFIPIKLGNIKEDNLLDIWHNHEVFKKIRARNEFKGNCGKCKHRNICGGCRARAYAYFNDIQGPDPGCKNNSESYDKLKKGIEIVIKNRS